MGRLATLGRGYYVDIPNKANSDSLDVGASAAFAANAATVARMAEAKVNQIQTELTDGIEELREQHGEYAMAFGLFKVTLNKQEAQMSDLQ